MSLTADETRDEIMAVRDLMGSRDFWTGDEFKIQNIAKALWYTYLEAHPQYRSIAMGTVKEFCMRRVYAIGLRQKLGLSNQFDAVYKNLEEA